MSTITTPAQAFSPLPGANSEGYGYLQLNVGADNPPIPHTGIDMNINHGNVSDDLNKPVVSAWDGRVVFTAPSELFSWGRLIVIRHVLPYDVVSAGQLVRAGTVIYARYGHLQSFSCWKGQQVLAGQEVGRCGGSNGRMDGPFINPTDKGDSNGQWYPHLHYDLRLGGPKGIPAWDAGDIHAVQEWPSVQAYGYPPALGTPVRTFQRVVALRFLDPNAAIPGARQPNATPCPRVL